MEDWVSALSAAAGIISLIVALHLAVKQGAYRKTTVLLFLVLTLAFFGVFLEVRKKPEPILRGGGGDPQPAPKRDVGGSRRQVGQRPEVYADFSAPEIQASNIRVMSKGAFAYNDVFGGSWRISAPGGGFAATVVLPRDARYDLIVTHLSSMEPSCPGRGFSPITIRMNSEIVAADYDPASHHAARHDMVEDRWAVNGKSGANYLEWTAGALCTHYWVKRIEIQPSEF